MAPDTPHPQWTYRARVEGGRTVFDVYDESDSEEPVFAGMLIERNAQRLIASVKQMGGPDLSVCIDDQRGFTRD